MQNVVILQATSNNILGYKITTLDVVSCIELIISWISSDEPARYFVCANPHSLVVAESDPVFKSTILAADLVTPDGVGILLASRILGGTIRERVTGSDIFWELSTKLNNEKRGSCFFLGSTEESLSAIKNKMAQEFPNITITGSYSPPYKTEFSAEDNRLMLEAVNNAEPDVLWVGMTAPKQEKWIYQNKDKLNVKFIGAIGAVFDFYTGKVKRSYPIFQKMGLEWLPRLLWEPRRLCNRMLISAPMFLYRVAKQRFSQNRGGAKV